MTDETHQAYVAAFGAEHHELRHLVHALHEALREERPWSHEAATEAVELLAALHTHLEHHFAQEEDGGYLEEALNLAPTDAREVVSSPHDRRSRGDRAGRLAAVETRAIGTDQGADGP